MNSAVTNKQNVAKCMTAEGEKILNDDRPANRINYEKAHNDECQIAECHYQITVLNQSR